MALSFIELNPRRVLLLLVLAIFPNFLPIFGNAQGNARSAPQASEPQRPLDNLFLLQNTKTARISTWDRKGGNDDFVTITPGETHTVAEIKGAGIIRRVYFALAGPDRMRWRKLVLRMYWDGQKDPDVEVPLGDFFGAGLGTIRTFQSLIVSINPGKPDADFDAVTSYFPMPFEHGARITVENDSDLRDSILYYHVEYEQYASGQLPANAGRFHAQWRRVVKTPIPAGIHKDWEENREKDRNTTGNDNYVILDTKGQGSFVGMFLTVDNSQGGWFGEGDDMIFVDGQKWPPTYPGTGHEEVFDEGCCPTREFSGPYTGFYLIESLNGPFGGKNQMYRFSVNNPVHFQKSILVTIEHGNANNYEGDYTTTAFWYQKDPHPPYPLLPPAKDRLPGWPAGVAEAMEAEVNLRSWRQTPTLGPLPNYVFTLSEADAKVVGELEAKCNLDFRELRYPDYIRDVKAMGDIFKRNPVKEEK